MYVEYIDNDTVDIITISTFTNNNNFIKNLI